MATLRQSMRVAVDCGLERLEFEVARESLIASRPPPAALPGPSAAVRAALESPHGYPALRRALAPGDCVTVVVDEQLPQLPALLVPLLEHVVSAGVAPEALTLLCPPSASRQPWLDELPDEFEEVHLEVHDPTDRKRLSYLATTTGGRRLYLNRTLVDADQVVVLSGRRYDPLLGYAGAAGSIYPALADQATRAEAHAHVHLTPPGEKPWRVEQEAVETAWLLGAPFFVQVIEAAGDEVAHVVAGAADASVAGRQLQDACWRQEVGRAADLVIASLGGDPARQTFADLAAALDTAARVARPGGRLVLLTAASPALGPGTEVLREAEEGDAALEKMRKHPTLETTPALRWAGATAGARVYLLSGLPGETVEELSATPLENAGQVQRLIDAGGSCLFLGDAHKALAILTSG